MKKNMKSEKNAEEWNGYDDENAFEQEALNENSDNLSASDNELQLEELQQKYSELNDNYLRLNAEFDNYRKRTLKEKADIIKSGGERVLMEIISLVDDFDRALSLLHEAESKDAMLEGMDLIYSKFIHILHQNGVKEIEALGEPFDPERFEAVTTVPVQEPDQKGTVIDCVQKGYELNGKIMRYPKVIVGE